jgi:hypothetical protein
MARCEESRRQIRLNTSSHTTTAANLSNHSNNAKETEKVRKKKMEVKCPKCRFRFTIDASPGMTEYQCNCPRCGTPFTYRVKADDAQAPAPTPVVPEAPAARPEVPQTVGAPAGGARGGYTGRTTPPPFHEPAARRQPSATGSTPPPPPPHVAPQAPVTPAPGRPRRPRPRRKKGCMERLLQVAIVLALILILFNKGCAACHNSQDDDNGVSVERPDNTDKTQPEDNSTTDDAPDESPTGANNQEFDDDEGPQEAPEWIQGNWRYNTQYGSIEVNISGDAITESANGETITGHFKYQDHVIYGNFGDGGSINYKLVESTHQIDCGNGMLMKKVD